MPQTRRLAAGRSGFTLLETAVVLALVGLILVAALPSYSNFVSNQRLEATARVVTSDLRVARQEAVTRRAPIAIGFAAADGGCTPAAASYTLFHGPLVLKRTCLPGDVEWAPVPAVRLVIQSVGIPQAGMTLTMRSARTGARRSVAISADSGAVDDVR
ncbi:MAG: GspH/FimT family pseudopilin [bacterium]